MKDRSKGLIGKSLDSQALQNAIGGTKFKVPYTISCSQPFKSVPRAWHSRYSDSTKAGIPHVGQYRPKFGYNKPRTAGKVAYGEKETWN